MTDELEPTGEQVEQEPVQETQEQPVQEPTQEPGELDVLKQQFANLEAKLGEQGNELGNLRNENAYYRNMAQVQPQNPQGPATGSQVGSEEEYDPYDQKSVDGYFARKQAQIDAKLNDFAQYQHRTQVGSALNTVQQIINSNPEYFRGHEQETIAMVSNLGNTGTVNPNLLANPDTVYGCADMIRGAKARRSAPQATPQRATALDTPSAVHTTPAPKALNTEISQEIVDRFYGGDRAAATKSMREGAEERTRERY